MHWLVREVVGRITRRVVRRWFARFERAAACCRETQERVLREKLRRNAASDFGRAHRFDQIRCAADFRSHIPITDYSFYEPYIDRVKRGETGAMFGPRAKVLMFALTSGTTSEPKYIPVTEESLQEYRNGWMLWGVRAYDQHPEIYRCKVLQLPSDWTVSHTQAGIPCGAISGLTAAGQKRIVRERYCLPSCIVKVRDVTAKHYLAIRLGITWPVGLVTAANPSTLVSLARTGDAERETLLRDLADGTLSSRFDVPRQVRDAAAKRISERHPQRVRELETIISRTGHLYPKDYWPTLQFLANWTGGSMGAYLRQFPQFWGTVPVRDIGLIASEGRMTIPLADGSPAGVLDILHQYFEFVPEAQIDDAKPTLLEAHELEQGQRYYILLTTSGGLYRYNISDLVRCVGFFGATPVLEFLNKGSRFSSLAGEKLSEFQVSCAVARSLAELDLVLKGFTLAPCWADPPHYTLLVEQDDLPSPSAASVLADSIDRHLIAQNLEYESKRATSRLGPVTVRLLPTGSWETFMLQRVAERGSAPEQYKHPCLVSDPDFVHRFRFAHERQAQPPRGWAFSRIDGGSVAANPA
jgi:hypothetical protein